MNRKDVARTFFARMDSHDTSGVMALVAPHADVTLVPLSLQGEAEQVGRQYSRSLSACAASLRR